MADPPLSDMEDFLKTDVLKDWMHQDDRNMSYPPSNPPPSSTTSSDNNAQKQQHRHYQQQQQQLQLSSLESFLFLPQLPVDGDDGDEDAWLFPYRHYPRQQQQQQQQSSSQLQQQRSLSSSLLAIVNPTTKSSSGIRSSYNNKNNSPSSSFIDRKNDCHKTSCNEQCCAATTTTTGVDSVPVLRRNDDSQINQSCCSGSSSHHHIICGSKPSKPNISLFPFIAANDTVIAAVSSNNSNNKDDDEAANNVVVNNNKTQIQKLSSSMSILIKSTSSGNNNSSHNHSTTSSSSPPFYLAANHHRQQEKHSHDHQQPHSHYRHLIRRRWLIFRICQVLSVLLCMLFLFNLVKNTIWADDEYKNRIVPLSSSLTSSSPASSSRLQNRLIQSWNMPSIISPSPSSSASAVSTFKFPEILSVASTSTHHNDDHDDDSNMHNLMLLDVPNFRFLMNNKTKCNIPRDNDNYFDGVGGDDDRRTNSNHGKPATNTASTIFFMIIVHSAPRNFEERQAIRETWGSLQRLGQFHIRLVFLLGHELNADDEEDRDYNHNSKSSNKNNNNIGNNNVVADGKGDKMSGGGGSSKRNHNDMFHARIQRESQEHGDIVTGNFHDSYRNLTYKHLMGYLWVLNHCSNAKYVLKADDDAFIDIFQLFEFLIRTFGKDPEPALICNVFPEGTKPVRGSDVLGKKWAVTYEEYPFEAYPKYCGGLAYLATPNVIHEIYRVSRAMRNKYLWIDDVYVTGILRELAHVEPFYLNLRYSYDPEEYRKWLSTSVRMKKRNEKDKENHDSISDGTSDNEINDSQRREEVATKLSNRMGIERRRATPSQKIPFMIVHMERGLQLGREMRELWNKTVIVWSESGLIN